MVFNAFTPLLQASRYFVDAFALRCIGLAC